MERYPIEQKDENYLETKSQVANIKEPPQKNPTQPSLKTVLLKTSL